MSLLGTAAVAALRNQARCSERELAADLARLTELGLIRLDDSGGDLRACVAVGTAPGRHRPPPDSRPVGRRRPPPPESRIDPPFHECMKLADPLPLERGENRAGGEISARDGPR